MKVYVYDGSFSGLLTSIYHSFYSKEIPYKICPSEDFLGDMLMEIINVESDTKLSSKVEYSIKEKIGIDTLRNVYLLHLSNCENKGILIYNYLKLGFKVGPNVNDMLHLDLMREINIQTRRVTLESHRMKGFLRFSYIDDKFLYSSISPDNNILEMISPHFQKRFPNEFWIIYDKKRGLASIYNKNSWEINHMSEDEYLKLKDYNDEYTNLWRAYFKSVTIKERLNPKLQKRMMPKRYWNELPEQ